MIDDNDVYCFQCPHCELFIQVQKTQVNCKIFRHGVYKRNNEHINPHTDKMTCDKLLNENEIYGCGKPFMFVDDLKGGYLVKKCEYI